MVMTNSLIFMGIDLTALYDRINAFIADTNVLITDVRVKEKIKNEEMRYFVIVTYTTEKKE